jgi:hypothetical protein
MDIIRMFKESTLTDKPNVFLDMDGVLVNWNKGYKQTLSVKDPEIIQATGYDLVNDTPHQFEDKLLQYYISKGENPKKAKSKAKGRFWKPIHGDYEWWVNLEWMPDGQDLFNYCLNLKQTGKIATLNILSSPSSDSVCEKGKRAWLDKQGITDKFDNIIIYKDKFHYAKSPLDILVDDTKKKVVEWEGISNGTPVFHTSAANSIEQLEKIIGALDAKQTSKNDNGTV